MLRCFILLAAIACSIVSAAQANAQSPQKWNGPYIGANIGYGWANVDGSLEVFDDKGVLIPHGPLNYSIEPEGMFGGIQIGINRRDGRLFAGIEADFQGADISGSSQTSFPGKPGVIFPFDYTASANIDWFGTVRGRLGIATDDLLIYVTGGVAIGRLDYSATYFITQPGPASFGGGGTLRSSETHVGYVLGAGIERALRSNWSLKLEYQYINFGDQEAQGPLFFNTGYPSGEKVTSRFDTDMHTVRVGLNYHFDTPQHAPLKP